VVVVGKSISLEVEPFSLFVLVDVGGLLLLLLLWVTALLLFDLIGSVELSSSFFLHYF